MKRLSSAILTVIAALIVVSCNKEIKMSISQTEFELPDTECKITPVIIATAPWTATTNEKWITIGIPEKVAGQKVFIAKIAANEEETARTGEITITCGPIVRKLKIIQQGIKVNYACLIIEHSRETFSIPSFFGEIQRGTINWGDGRQTPYNYDASHKYDSAGTYSVTIIVSDAEGFLIPKVEGISLIDITGFL